MGKVIRTYIAKGDALKVKYLGGTVAGCLTEGKVYQAAYFTKETDKGNVHRQKGFMILDDSNYYCYYKNSEFEILEESINDEIWNEHIFDLSEWEDE